MRNLSGGERIIKALELAMEYGGIDGGHHKMWVIDQMVRALTGCPMVETKVVNCKNPYTFEKMGESAKYPEWVEICKQDENGEIVYGWGVGIAP